MTAALEIKDIHKAFKIGFIPKKTEILKGITLTAHEGDIFGYLGPNGAGKTTTLKCILGLIYPDKGEVKIFNKPALSARAKQHIGFLPENPYFYDYLTAKEFLLFYCQLFRIKKSEAEPKAEHLLKLVGLEDTAGLQLRKFSKGMLQRIGLAQALLNDPLLVLLDEPLGGLDPLGRKDIRDIIVRLKEEGKTVFLSSHILQDIEMICDHVAIIVNGRIINQGNLQDLIAEKILFTELVLSGINADDLKSFGESLAAGDKVLLKVTDESKMDAVLNVVRTKNGRIHSLIPRTETLEDLFVDVVRQK